MVSTQSIYFIWKFIWLWDITAKRNIDTGHTGLFLYWAVFGCVPAAYEIERRFRSVFRFVSDNIWDNFPYIFCVVCTGPYCYCHINVLRIYFRQRTASVGNFLVRDAIQSLIVGYSTWEPLGTGQFYRSYPRAALISDCVSYRVSV